MYMHQLRITVIKQSIAFMMTYYAFSQFPKYYMRNFVENFNMKVGTEDIFKPAIRNESFHEISNYNGVRVVNFAT